jgi:hypothetical protein
MINVSNKYPWLLIQWTTRKFGLFISDSSLDDIKYVLNPTFDSELIKILDTTDKLSRAIDGTLYLPGIVGLNNIRENDYCNVVLQVMLHPGGSFPIPYTYAPRGLA